MTGEITLRGSVLPIGGLKEKIFAASRGGITKILIPKENVKDLRDVPKNILKGIEIVDVVHMDQVLQHALETDQVFRDPALVPKVDGLPVVPPVEKKPVPTIRSH